jgi:phosphoglycerate kinase
MNTLGRITSIRDINVQSKRVIVRLDFNVPLSEPNEIGIREVLDVSRIRETVPTLQHLHDRGARIVILSHLGRPKGKKNAAYSLLPAAQCLADLMKLDVILADDCVGEGIELRVHQLQDGDILVLENLRFYEEEEANDLEFAQQLARLGDIYVNDAFGTAHRKHASTYQLPALMPNRCMGFLIEKELKYFDRLLQQPDQPFYLILGGAKVSDKIKTIHSLMKRVQGVLVGGAMAYAFMKAQGKKIPAEWKQPAPEDVDAAKALLKESEERKVPFILPTDTQDGFDIGPQSIREFEKFLANARTVFWNGPLGWFEKKPYDAGTNAIAKMLAELPNCIKVVGGGDTVSAIHHAGFAESFDHLSTGGGAALEYLELEGLPGIEALKKIGHRAESPNLE